MKKIKEAIEKIARPKSVKEIVLLELDHSLSILDDIVKNNKSIDVQGYAKAYADIESPVIGGTDAPWIRIQCGGVYIYDYLDSPEVRYQLDFQCGCGGELIDVYSIEDFLQELQKLSDEEIIKSDSDLEDEWFNGNFMEDWTPVTYVPMPDNFHYITREDKEFMRTHLEQAVAEQLSHEYEDEKQFKEKFGSTDTLEDVSNLYVQYKCYEDIIARYKEYNELYPHNEEFLLDLFGLTKEDVE